MIILADCYLLMFEMKIPFHYSLHLQYYPIIFIFTLVIGNMFDLFLVAIIFCEHVTTVRSLWIQIDVYRGNVQREIDR